MFYFKSNALFTTYILIIFVENISANDLNDLNDVGYESIHPCKDGCNLYYDKRFNCNGISFEAFVPNTLSINKAIDNNYYECFYNGIESINQANNNIEETERESIYFDLDSYVLIWQAIIIAIIVPITALLIFKLLLLIFNKCKCFKYNHYNNNNNNKCKCKCCLYFCSSEYRQQRRNQQFHNEIYNPQQPNINKQKSWRKIFKYKKNQNNNDNNDNNNANNNNDNDEQKENNDDNNDNRIINNGENNGEYQHVVNMDDDVLEEISIEHNNDNNNDNNNNYFNQNSAIELSFSSTGLRNICNHDVV